MKRENNVSYYYKLQGVGSSKEDIIYLLYLFTIDVRNSQLEIFNQSIDLHAVQYNRYGTTGIVLFHIHIGHPMCKQNIELNNFLHINFIV